MNHLETAKDILALVGGKDNIEHLEHCSTRLRLSLYDNSKVNEPELTKVPGVLGVRVNVQCQVIIGHDVIQVYQAMKSVGGDSQNSGSSETKSVEKKVKYKEKIIDFIISVFQPLIPAIAGGGMLKSFLLLFSALGWISNDTSTYKIIDHIGTAPLYFLPILVAITTATKLKVNILVAVSAVSVLVLPSMAKQLAEGAEFLSFDIRNVTYASQVFPAILSVLLYAQTEKFFNKYTPGPLRVFLSPMFSLLITVPVTLLVLGPLGYEMGSWLAIGFLWIYSKLGFVATGLLAGILPFMVAAGMQKAMLPFAVTYLTQYGRELLYLPASLAHNIAQSGACFAVALKSRNKALKSTALSAGISALFGITEPAIYGVTLLHKKALYSVIIGSVIGGMFIGLLGVEAFALVAPGLASISMYVSPFNPMNIVWALAGAAISFGVAFVSVMVLWRDHEHEKNTKETVHVKSEATGTLSLTSPIEGKVIPIESVNDEVFSRKIVGDGIAIIPSKGLLIAPADGTVEHVFESGHALNFMTNDGVELIFHIGIDTVKLDGKGFNPLVTEGQKVKQGDALITFSLETIESAGLDPVVIMAVTNGERFTLEPVFEPKNNTEQPGNPQIIMTLKESV